jgi:hypothetical protein
MTDTPNLALPLMAAHQAQKHVTHNEALMILDMLAQLAVQSAALGLPPSSPADGERWIVAAGASGAWAGRATDVAAWQDGAWRFSIPRAGWLAYDVAASTLRMFDGAAWVSAFAALQNLPSLGINTTADATNRLAVKSDAALFSHDDATPGTGDVRVALNKSAAARDASIALQDGYSTRALIGLLADDDLAIKVSPDGASYATAAKFDRATGDAAFARDVVAGRDLVAARNATLAGYAWRITTAGDANWGFGLSNSGGRFYVDAFGSFGSNSGGGFRVIGSGTTKAIFDADGTGNAGVDVGAATVLPAKLTVNGAVAPWTDNSHSCGLSAWRWSVVYAATGAISTSNALEKTDPTPLDEALLLAALDTQIVQYRWRDAVARKGAGARLHVGPTAQSFRDACRARGIDARRYAVYCEDPVLAPATKRRVVARMKIERVEIAGEAVVIEDGVPVLRADARIVERPAMEMKPVRGADGAILMRAAAGRKGEGDEAAPLLHPVPAMEEVEEEHVVLEPTGDIQFGLRLDQFDRLLAEARWRVLRGDLVWTPPA